MRPQNPEGGTTFRGMLSPPTQGDDSDRYMDTASGLAPGPTVLRALDNAWRTASADPGRRYPDARLARRLLDHSRSAVAAAFGVPTAGVWFAGSYPAAVWLALTAAGPSQRLIVSDVEDLTILRTADLLAPDGIPVSTWPVDHTGQVDMTEIPPLDGATVVVQDGNIELGTRQPLADVAAAMPPDAGLVVDLRAVAGRETITEHFDIAFADARMWGGPAGVAVVVARDPARFRPAVPVTDGHGHVEDTHPPVPLIAAAALALESPDPRWPRLRAVRDLSRRLALARISDVAVLGHPDDRVGYLTMLTFLYVPADELVDLLAERGWSVASGASCTADTRRPHHVLVAIGASTHGSLRVSLGPWSTTNLIEQFVTDLEHAVSAIRAGIGATDL